jgi:hypothetical protein
MSGLNKKSIAEMIDFAIHNSDYIKPAGTGSEAVFDHIKLCYAGEGTLFAAIDPEKRMPEGSGPRGFHLNENNRIIGIPGYAVDFTDMDLIVPCQDSIAFFFKICDCLVFGRGAFGPRAETVVLDSAGI